MRGATMFSGIAAPETAAPWIDWRWCAEIEPFPCHVLHHRHGYSGPIFLPKPNDTMDDKERARVMTARKLCRRIPRGGKPNLGDVSHAKFIDTAKQQGPIDVLVFGSPCQSFSVAGKRLGLTDPRGNLALIALGVIDALRPTWFTFENVPGLIPSGGGRDFGAFLGTVADIGYVGGWSVLDAQWHGVAQRRRRLFFVGHVRDWCGPAAVLSEFQSLLGDTPACVQARQRTARATVQGTGKRSFWQAVAAAFGGGASAGDERSGEAGGVKDVAPTISARTKGGGGLGTDFDLDGGLIGVGGAPCTCPAECDCENPGTAPSEAVTHYSNSCPVHNLHPNPVAGCEAREHINGAFATSGLIPETAYCPNAHPSRRYDAQANETFVACRDVAATVTSQMQGGSNQWAPINEADNLIAHALRAEGFDAPEDGTGRGTPIVPVGTFQNTGQGWWKQSDVATTIRTPEGSGSLEANVVAFHENQRGEVTVNDTAGSLKVGGGKPGQGYPAVAVALRGRDGGAMAELGDEISNALRSSQGGGDKAHVLATCAVRRLSVVECARLQGFPDVYAHIPWRKRKIDSEEAAYLMGHGLECWQDGEQWFTKVAADGPMYRAYGNSMALPVMAWILNRIRIVDEAQEAP